MVTLLFEALFSIFGKILGAILYLIPQPKFISQFLELYGGFLTVIKFGWRFVKFTFGDFTYLFTDALLLFCTLKYVLLPIVTVLRSVIAHGGGGD